MAPETIIVGLAAFVVGVALGYWRGLERARILADWARGDERLRIQKEHRDRKDDG